MNADDRELKRMFDALRLIDEEQAPACDDPRSHLDAVHGGPPTRRFKADSITALAATALMLCSGLGLVLTGGGSLQTVSRNGAATGHERLRRVNEICDDLQVTIRMIDSESTVTPIDHGMEWPTGTESLLPHDIASYESGVRSPQ